MVVMHQYWLPNFDGYVGECPCLYEIHIKELGGNRASGWQCILKW